MKLFEVAEKAQDSGEYILGSRETGSHACYLIYGALHPGEKGRELRPGHGHEEIVLALTGDLRLTGHFTGTLKQGQALHLTGEESVFLENTSNAQALYVIAGGHSGHGHHE
ncbi:MAG TPA: hypothetical protein VF905_12455 [Nitrospirota bacterium]